MAQARSTLGTRHTHFARRAPQALSAVQVRRPALAMAAFTLLVGAAFAVMPRAHAATLQAAVTVSVSASLDLPALPVGAGGTGSPGDSRAGRAIDVEIKVAATGDTAAFTIFEPTVFTPGQSYPLVLHGHGYGGSRATASGSPVPVPTPAGAPDLTGDAAIADLRANGYGVVSIDQRGHGDSSGNVRVMDPDFEGKDLLAILDWLEANLNWLRYGPSNDGRDPHNLVLGSMGGSYGGMYQLLLTHIDPKRRLDAIVPEIAPHDLPYSLAPGSVPKALWDPALLLLGSRSGVKTGSTSDPFLVQQFAISFAQNQLTPGLRDFFAYHSTSYWCSGKPVLTNGGPGTRPELMPRQAPRTHALFIQGMRDTLFNFNAGLANQQCLARSGGDVRLMTTQTGHNTLQIVPDPGAYAFQNPQDQLKDQCGRVQTMVARRAFFDQYLKGIAGAADIVPRQTCLSLSGDDAVLVDQVTTGRSGTAYTVPSTKVVAGAQALPSIVKLGERTGGRGDVVAGVPHVALTLSASPLSALVGGDPIVFVGTGVVHTSGLIELVDNQLQPLRGLGTHDVALPGVGKRLPAGSQLVLLVYGAHEQYAITGSLGLNVRQATVMPVTVSGTAWMPRLGIDLRAP